MPSLVEFFGYILHFAGIVHEPGFFYTNYIEFINGENIRKQETEVCRNLGRIHDIRFGNESDF